MRVLTVNYPKQHNDEKKIKYLEKSYNTHLRQQILAESDSVKVPEIEL
jgi:hypothetical protein